MAFFKETTAGKHACSYFQINLCACIFILKLVCHYNHVGQAKMFKYGTFQLSSVSRVEVVVVVVVEFLYFL